MSTTRFSYLQSRVALLLDEMAHCRQLYVKTGDRRLLVFHAQFHSSARAWLTLVNSRIQDGAFCDSHRRRLYNEGDF